MVFNTAPTVDWLPYEINLKPGKTIKIPFGEPFDFEDNQVRLEYVGL